MVWSVPENIETTVTLFKDPRTNEYEDKEWQLVIEDVTEKAGKRKQVRSFFSDSTIRIFNSK